MTRFAQKAWRKVAVPLNYHINDSGITESYRMDPVSGEVPNLVNGVGNLSKYGQSTFSNSIIGKSVYFTRDGVWRSSIINPLPFFCSMWVRVAEYSASNQFVGVKYRANTAAYYFGLAHFNSNTWGLFDYGTAANNLLYRVTSTATLPLPWQHIVWGRSADDTIKMWVDGQPSANNFVTTNPWTDPAPGDADERFAVGGRPLPTGAISIPMNGSVGLTEIYNGEMTNAKALSLYQKGARAIQFATDWGHDADGINRTTPEYLGNGPFEVADAGTFRCETDTINDQTVKAFTCNTPGHVVVDLSRYVSEGDASRGYGSWGCWFYVPDDGAKLIRWHLFNTVRAPAAASGNGYRVDLDGSGTADLVEQGVGNVIGGGALTPGQWNHCHVTRRYDGLFELFINDVSQGTGTDNTTAGARYMSFQMSADCKVAVSDPRGGYAITKYLGVVPPRM